MSETEWQKCNDIVPMMEFLGDRAAAWEYRQFCIACCRHVWDVMPEEGRRAVTSAERYMAGQATDGEMEAANREVGDLCEREGVRGEPAFAAFAAFHATFWRCMGAEAKDCARNAESAGPSLEMMCRLLRETVRYR